MAKSNNKTTMKTIAVTLIMLGLAYLSFGQETTVVKPSATADFAWRATTYDFGKTKAGYPLTYEFGFSNTGMAPLIISSVKASCGCTVTAYTKEPVQHGASGFVRATYDAQQPGVYSKTIAVYANTPGGIVNLTIKGEIVK